MTFFDLCVAVLLFFNSAAVLNEHRFLAKRGWYAQDFTSGAPGTSSSLKGQALGIITAVSYMRMPLIVINTVVILVKLVFG